jgi:hypothetical protein
MLPKARPCLTSQSPAPRPDVEAPFIATRLRSRQLGKFTRSQQQALLFVKICLPSLEREAASSKDSQSERVGKLLGELTHWPRQAASSPSTYRLLPHTPQLSAAWRRGNSRRLKTELYRRFYMVASTRRRRPERFSVCADGISRLTCRL